MAEIRSPRRVSILAVAGFSIQGIAILLWAWCAWTNWWISDIHDRPERELDAPLVVEDGAHATNTFTPNAGIPHLLLVEFEAGFSGEPDGACPISLQWSVAVGDRVLAEGDADHLKWRVGEPGMGVVWLGVFDARRDEEHVITTRVGRGLRGATARLHATRDDQVLKNARILAFLLTRLAWVPFGLGLLLLVVAWFRRRFRIRRLP